MTLQEDLRSQAAQIAEAAPQTALDALDAGVDELRRSTRADSSLAVGDRAPDFELPDATGTKVALAGLLQAGPVVLSFYRGSWCPYCSLELRALQAILPDLTAAGASLVALSPQTPDESLSTVEKAGLTFAVLTDDGLVVARKFGLVYQVDEATKTTMGQFGTDLAVINGTDSWELPIAATYVIDVDGRVAFAFADPDFRHRPEPADVLAAVRGLSSK